MNIDPSALYTPAEAARMLHPSLTARTMTDAATAGKIAKTKIGKAVFFRGSDILEYVKSCRSQPQHHGSSCSAQTASMEPRPLKPFAGTSGISSGVKEGEDVYCQRVLSLVGARKRSSLNGSENVRPKRRQADH